MTTNTHSFDLQDRDTCMKQWTFHLSATDGQTIIRNLHIQKDKQGCEGHPKTIMALMKNTPIGYIDLEALRQTTCVRGQSCGMILAECLETLNNGNQTI